MFVCVSFIVINMAISISCKKIYKKINDMNMNLNILCPYLCIPSVEAKDCIN